MEANRLNRRQFIKTSLGLISLSSAKYFEYRFPENLPKDITKKYPDIVHVEQGNIYTRIKTSIDALGGIENFVKPGDKVVIKPNAAFAQRPEMGGNTTPEVVGAVIRLCKKMHPESVTIVEHCLSSHGRFGSSRDISGITQAALSEGAEVFDAGIIQSNYEQVKIDAPQAKYHGIIRKFLEADVVINIPRAKTHPFAGYTLCAKNLMGTMQNPKIFHTVQNNWIKAHWRGLQQRLGIQEFQHPYNLLPANLVALTKFMQSYVKLNIVDMTHLVRDWSSTKPGNLETKNIIIAGTNLVTTDAYCVKMFGSDPLRKNKFGSIDNYISLMHNAGIGNADLNKCIIKKIIL